MLFFKIRNSLFTRFFNMAAFKSKYRQSSDYGAFHDLLSKSKHVVVLSGAGISAESGVPTFRGAGGMWRKYQATDLATPEAFEGNPSLVWEFYHYRRELVLLKRPNKGHYAVADAQVRFAREGRTLTVITQNVDELHTKAGAKDLIEMHGNLFTTRCTKCGDIRKNYDSPICRALAGRGAPDIGANSVKIPDSELPRCKIDLCGGMLRPHIVWFGESLEPSVLNDIDANLEKCDLLLVVGTSSVVYPAAGYSQLMAAKGVPIAEFNIDPTPTIPRTNFYFEGPSGETLPKALATTWN